MTAALVIFGWTVTAFALGSLVGHAIRCLGGEDN